LSTAGRPRSTAHLIEPQTLFPSLTEKEKGVVKLFFLFEHLGDFGKAMKRLLFPDWETNFSTYPFNK
jgi:hypothetical protein